MSHGSPERVLTSMLAHCLMMHRLSVCQCLWQQSASVTVNRQANIVKLAGRWYNWIHNLLCHKTHTMCRSNVMLTTNIYILKLPASSGCMQELGKHLHAMRLSQNASTLWPCWADR